MILNFVCALILTIIAVYYDYSTFKIPNKFNLIAVSVSLSLVLLEVIMGFKVNVLESLLYAIILFVAGYMIYLFGGIGAGDVKFFVSLAILLGYSSLICFGASLVFAVIIGVVEILRKKSVVVNSRFSFKLHKIHYSYAILAGLIFSLVFTRI